jgi:hypothetical protein
LGVPLRKNFGSRCTFPLPDKKIGRAPLPSLTQKNVLVKINNPTVH